MFRRLMAFFCGKAKQAGSSAHDLEQQEASDRARHGEKEQKPFGSQSSEQGYGHKSLDHARELSLAFISSMLGVRSLDTEESIAQEALLSASLDEELVGLSDESIPKLSKVALGLMADLLNPETLESKIIAAIQDDLALADNVISVANSPAFNTDNRELKDLEHALSLVGDKGLKDLVMSSLVIDQFEVNSAYFEAFGEALWEHSTEVAINAKRVAVTIGADPSLSYFIGLIHDIGKLIIFKKLVELHSKDKVEPHPQVFSHLLNDYSHALTRQACELWELPERWYQPIIEFQMAEPGDLTEPESIALFLGNSFAELHSLHQAGEITDFELVWRLTEVGSSIDEYRRLYPDTAQVES